MFRGWFNVPKSELDRIGIHSINGSEFRTSALNIMKASRLSSLGIAVLLIIFSGCAALPRKTTLVDVRTGEVLRGGFNLVTRDGWVVMPDGTRLTGKIVGVPNARQTTHSFRGTASTYPVISPEVSFSGSGNSYTSPTAGQGWALLTSPDGKQIMEITVVSSGNVMAGYGDALMNDGRRFKVTW